MSSRVPVQYRCGSRVAQLLAQLDFLWYWKENEAIRPGFGLCIYYHPVLGFVVTVLIATFMVRHLQCGTGCIEHSWNAIDEERPWSIWQHVQLASAPVFDGSNFLSWSLCQW